MLYATNVGEVSLFLLEPFAAMLLTNEPALVVPFLQMLAELCFFLEINSLDSPEVLLLAYLLLIQHFVDFFDAEGASYDFFVLAFDVFSELITVGKGHVAAAVGGGGSGVGGIRTLVPLPVLVCCMRAG